MSQLTDKSIHPQPLILIRIPTFSKEKPRKIAGDNPHAAWGFSAKRGFSDGWLTLPVRVVRCLGGVVCELAHKQ